ncbi:MAG: hypothetical protein M1498_03805 [Candidatus Thermoplasmatota archaeon]|nr:hypothetical protein [Candidatus Thermoplasmatota archaeon]
MVAKATHNDECPIVTFQDIKDRFRGCNKILSRKRNLNQDTKKGGGINIDMPGMGQSILSGQEVQP